MKKTSLVRERTSRRVLLASADANLRQSIAAQLRDCEVEVFVAEDDQIAVTQFGRQTFPVVVCECKPGTQDASELVRRIRCIAIEPVYILMLAHQGTQEETDAMYRAGVDQLIPRLVPKKILQERIHTAFKAISLRRISRVIGNSDVVTVDLASGAHTARHLVGRLSAEIDLARRTNGTLEIAIVRIGSAHSDITVSEDLLAVLEAVQASLRPHRDWIAWLHTVGHSHRLAVIMPNAGHGAAAALQQHVRNAFVFENARELPELGFGHVLFEPQDSTGDSTTLALLARAEQQLRALDPPSGLSAKSMTGDVETVQ